MAAAGENTLEAQIFVFNFAPPVAVALNPVLVNSFAKEDLRKSAWIRAVSDENSTWYHAHKYKEIEFTPVSKEYSIVFRLAEQYLIRAEARAFQGDLIGAKEDLNKIRHRAGLDNTLAVSQEQILQAVLSERQWEFFSEHAHRFFDLKRLSRLDEKLSSVKPGWNSADALSYPPK